MPILDDNFSVFNDKKGLDPIQTDKAIRGIYEMMKGVQRRQAWPVGSIFISINGENPSELLGYGTWVPYGSGRVIIGIEEAL
jgi:hypothetical protein